MQSNTQGITISAHRLDADDAPGKIRRGPGRKGDLARRHRCRCRPPGDGKAPGSRSGRIASHVLSKDLANISFPRHAQPSGLFRPQAAGALQELGVLLFESRCSDGVPDFIVSRRTAPHHERHVLQHADIRPRIAGNMRDKQIFRRGEGAVRLPAGSQGAGHCMASRRFLKSVSCI